MSRHQKKDTEISFNAIMGQEIYTNTYILMISVEFKFINGLFCYLQHIILKLEHMLSFQHLLHLYGHPVH